MMSNCREGKTMWREGLFLFSHHDSVIALLKGRWVGHSVIVERPLKSRGGGRAVNQERTTLLDWKRPSFQRLTHSKAHCVSKVSVTDIYTNLILTFTAVCHRDSDAKVCMSVNFHVNNVHLATQLFGWVAVKARFSTQCQKTNYEPSRSLLVLTSPQARLEMPVNWRWHKISRWTHQWAESRGWLNVAVSIEETECPGAHWDVTITFSGGDRGRRGSHRDIWLILVSLNSHST